MTQNPVLFLFARNNNVVEWKIGRLRCIVSEASVVVVGGRTEAVKRAMKMAVRRDSVTTGKTMELHKRFHFKLCARYIMAYSVDTLGWLTRGGRGTLVKTDVVIHVCLCNRIRPLIV